MVLFLTDFGFTGQQDYSYIQLGLMDFNARFYSPRLGKFIQPDSIIPDLTNSQAWNRYSYVLNSPIKYVDPSGHMYCDWDPKTGGCSDEGYDAGGGTGLDGSDYGWDPRTPGYGGGRNSNSDVDWTTPEERLKMAIDRGIPKGIGVSFSIGPEMYAVPLLNGEGEISIELVYLWQNGTLVAVVGYGAQANIGTPSIGGDISIGLVTYYNVDNPDDLKGKDNFGEIEIGGEVLGTASISKSVSVAVNEITGKPIRNPYNNGIMYSRETALNFGLDLFSTGGDFQLGGGVSQTDWVWIIIE